MARPECRFLLLIVFALLILSSSASFAGIVYVKRDSPNDGPGNDWEHAFHRIYLALDAAVSGDEVWVAAGTYVENITLKDGVGLYGGFAGTETSREQRDWNANVTILDGNQRGSVVTSPSGATAATTIDGFTIANGSANYGGGIHCSTSSPTITNNTITGNKAYSNGGGIYCSNSSPVISSNTITRNTASNNGAGIYCYSSSPIITNNTITGNSASSGGGVYCAETSSSPEVANNIIAFNSCGIYNSDGAPHLRNNCVYGNASYDYSGLSAGLGDISADPIFADASYGNLHIQPESPCVNAGWNDAPGLSSTDMDGQPRIQGGTVDIGADESDGTSWPSGPYAIVRVTPDGKDWNDGSSWALAKRTVQAALDALLLVGGEVWAKAGTYNEQITLHPYVHLYGGFAGTETARAQRNWKTNVTILDRSGTGSVVRSICGYGASTIDGFTIRNEGGPGIHCRYSSPTITNNTIIGNSASYGGGIHCFYSSPVISNNTITQNTAYSGAGIYCDSSSPVITNNTIAGNTASAFGAGAGGGGIYCSSSSPIITNNTITGNSASKGGGMFCAETSSSPEVANNIIAFNSSGIYNSDGAPTLRNNCVYGNASYNYSGLSAGLGDISADPIFADAGYANLHIQPESPCVNAGWNDAPGLSSTDMDGQARIQGGTVDIGADESDGTSWPSGPHAIVRVSPDGNDYSPGSSWASAKRTIQAAIDVILLVGGEVWAKAGTYNELITLHPYVHLYGGFAGTETARAQRNWKTNVTILDGGAAGTVVTATAGYRVSTIDGFTIRNGSNHGISCALSSPRITNNTITDNTASHGGGIRCSSSSPVISNNAITRNTASNCGGGIYCSGSSSPTITNNAITGNIASSNYGGGIYCSSASPVIANNTITGNTASYRGAGIYCSSASPIITNNTITGNSAYKGGGMYCIGTSSSPEVANNIIAFNSSGIYNWDSVPTLRNNCVYGNIDYDYSGLSGGLGDISADPIFADASYGNLHIQPESPCVNAGWNDAPGLSSTDMDGQARIQDGTVDIGADESDGTSWPSGPYAIVRVTPDGNDSNDGSSWALAKRTIQAAIDVTSVLGGEVWAKAGTYNERITLHPYVHLYGGFAGMETARAQRNWKTNVTILDGGAAGSVVTARAGFGVSTIDGFTIRNGTGTGSIGKGPGGGIYCSYSSPAISNNTITGNTAPSSGGGIYCSYSSPVISNNTINLNTAYSGAGIYCDSSSPVITNNTIAGNTVSRFGTTVGGGGIYCSSSSPIITGNTITGNSAPSGGGVYCAETSSSPEVANNIIAFNSSGIYNLDGAPTLRNNCVYGNASYDYSGLSAGLGDISADPIFADASYGNLHIQPESPCVNAGWNDAPGLSSTDMDGQARIQGGTVDIGADESDGTSWPSGPYAIVRVTPDGNDSNDGSSWLLAKRTVQAGTDAASAQGGDVWVAAGIYDERIVLRPHAHLYGGFAGTETTRQERDCASNVTVLDGQQGGSVVTATAGHTFSAIDGFTIRNGGADNGGGIYCSYCSPTITNNTITDNTASFGGGIYCTHGSPVIASNIIAANSSERIPDYGTGIYCTDGSPVIASNIIAANSSGGIWTSGAAITNNTFADNGGRAIYCSSSSSSISNNIVAFNAIGISAVSGSTPVLQNNCVFGNTTYDYSELSPGEGDFSADPLFVDQASGDYHIQDTSPCVNAGYNSAPGLPTTDIDGQDRICMGTVDIGADEALPSATSVAGAKGLANYLWAGFKGKVVTCVATTSQFYIEEDDRSSGILVYKVGHGLSPSQRADIAGKVRTASTGERYIGASYVTEVGTGSIEPLFLVNRSIGGGDWNYDPATGGGQKGVKEYRWVKVGDECVYTLVDAVGLNNIGLLITTTGRVTYADPAYFYLDDGSAAKDDSVYTGVKVLPCGLAVPAEGSYVKVTGASSCFKSGDDLYRQIKAAEIAVIEP